LHEDLEEEISMRKLNMGWVMAVALGLAIPSFSTAFAATGAKAAKTEKSDEAAAPSSAGMSKEDQQKLAEHNKLRAEIKKVRYPAAKAAIVNHVKGLSADDVFNALGWEAAPAPSAK
jgi:hypothetical protein